MTRLTLAAITVGFMVLSAVSSFGQTSESNAPRSQSTASGSPNSASTGTESNSDQPDLATRRAKNARRAQSSRTQSTRIQSPDETNALDQRGSATTASGASNSSPGKSKFPGAGP